jgi:hypothetical protein
MRTTGFSALLVNIRRMFDKYPGYLAAKQDKDDESGAWRLSSRDFGWRPTVWRDEALHEGVHAFDFWMGIYASRVKRKGDGWDDAAQRLAWATEHLASEVEWLALFERRVHDFKNTCGLSDDVSARLSTQWSAHWRTLANMSKVWTWTPTGGTVPQPLLLDRDLGDVNAKLHFRVSCSIIRAALEKEYHLEPGLLDCPDSLPLMLK